MKNNKVILPSGQLEAFHICGLEKRFRRQGHPLKNVDNSTTMYIIPSKEKFKELGFGLAYGLVCKGLTINYNPTPELPEVSVDGGEYMWDYEYSFESVEVITIADLTKYVKNPYDFPKWSGYPQYWEA